MNEGTRQHRGSQLNLAQFRRYQRIRELLRKRAHSIQELASALGCDEKVVDRDLKRAREEWGWRVNHSRRDGRMHAEGYLALPLLHLTE